MGQRALSGCVTARLLATNKAKLEESKPFKQAPSYRLPATNKAKLEESEPFQQPPSHRLPAFRGREAQPSAAGKGGLLSILEDGVPTRQKCTPYCDTVYIDIDTVCSGNKQPLHTTKEEEEKTKNNSSVEQAILPQFLHNLWSYHPKNTVSTLRAIRGTLVSESTFLANPHQICNTFMLHSLADGRVPFGCPIVRTYRRGQNWKS